MGVSLPRHSIPDHLLADLHAQNLPADAERDLWERIATDPEAGHVLDALDDVTAVLRQLRDTPQAPPAPADIVARLEGVLESCTNDELAARRRDTGSPRRRISRRWVAGLSAAAAGVAVVIAAGAALASGVFSSGADSESTAVVASATPGAEINSLSHQTLMSALGRESVVGRLADRNLLSECLAGASASGPILGMLDVDYRGNSGVLVLVGQSGPGGITALVLGTACNHDDPRILARTELR
ncbi:hypothetical protein [Aldersonia kunmingensis]|uniref:hypothetical protein n=1 Tax=Aldersonia kunmingensis TaxID=408066 RepID=UPI000A6CDCFA|nr:hypothetical protein [Aldersonia kunmingensis]